MLENRMKKCYVYEEVFIRKRVIIACLISIILIVILGREFSNYLGEKYINISFFQKTEVAIALIPITLGIAIVNNINKLYLGKTIGHLLLIKKSWKIGYWEWMTIAISLPFINLYVATSENKLGFIIIFIINLVVIYLVIKKSLDILYGHKELNRDAIKYLKYKIDNINENNRLKNFFIIGSIKEKLENLESADDEIDFIKYMFTKSNDNEYVNELFEDLIGLLLETNNIKIINEFLDDNNEMNELEKYREKIVTYVVKKSMSMKYENVDEKMIILLWKIYKLAVDNDFGQELIKSSLTVLKNIHNKLVENEDNEKVKKFYSNIINLHELKDSKNIIGNYIISDDVFYQDIVRKKMEYIKNVTEQKELWSKTYENGGSKRVNIDAVKEFINSLVSISELKKFEFNKKNYIKYNEKFKLMTQIRKYYIENLLENNDINEEGMILDYSFLKWNDVVVEAESVKIREVEKEKGINTLSEIIRFIEIESDIANMYKWNIKKAELKKSDLIGDEFRILLHHMNWLIKEKCCVLDQYEEDWQEYKYRWIICCNSIVYPLWEQGKVINKKIKSEKQNNTKDSDNIIKELERQISLIKRNDELLEYINKHNIELFEDEKFRKYILERRVEKNNIQIKYAYEKGNFIRALWIIAAIYEKNYNVIYRTNSYDLLEEVSRVDLKYIENIEKFLGIRSGEREKEDMKKEIIKRKEELIKNEIKKKGECGYYVNKRKMAIKKRVFQNLISEKYQIVDRLEREKELKVYINFERYMLKKFDDNTIKLLDAFSEYRENNNMNSINEKLNEYLVERLKENAKKNIDKERRSKREIFISIFKISENRDNLNDEIVKRYEKFKTIFEDYNKRHGIDMEITKNEKLENEMLSKTKVGDEVIELDIDEVCIEFSKSRLELSDLWILEKILKGVINPKVKISDIEIKELNEKDVEILVERVFSKDKKEAIIDFDTEKINFKREEYKEIVKYTASKIQMKVRNYD